MRNSEQKKTAHVESYVRNMEKRKWRSSKVVDTKNTVRRNEDQVLQKTNFEKEHQNMNEVRNEIKSYIVRRGMTMNDVVALLADEYGWSTSVSNLSDKLRRGSLRYREAVELADVLDYDIVWQKRR